MSFRSPPARRPTRRDRAPASDRRAAPIVASRRVVLPRHQPGHAPDANAPPDGAFPSEILPGFLYLGTYDHSARADALRALGVEDVLNCVPDSQCLHRNAFNYHVLSRPPTNAADVANRGDAGNDTSAAAAAATSTSESSSGKEVHFAEAIAFFETSRARGRRCMAYCMTGTSRSASAVIAYLMHAKRWRLTKAHAHVKERRALVNVQPAAAAQLSRFEREIFGDAVVDAPSSSPSPSGGFGGGAGAWSARPNPTHPNPSDPSNPCVGFGAGGDASFAFCRNVGDGAPFVFGAGGNGNG
jgi:dual specificity MAP kinase phosphatase